MIELKSSYSIGVSPHGNSTTLTVTKEAVVSLHGNVTTLTVTEDIFVVSLHGNITILTVTKEVVVSFHGNMIIWQYDLLSLSKLL